MWGDDSGQFTFAEHDGKPEGDGGVHAGAEGADGAGDEAEGIGVGEGGDYGDGFVAG